MNTYQCDICLQYLDHERHTTGFYHSDHDEDSECRGRYFFVGQKGPDAALRNLIDASENILGWVDQDTDEYKWLISAIQLAKKVRAEG